VRFGFSEDQRLFQQTFAELLANECSHEALAAAWETEDGAVPDLWQKIAEMGVLGLTVPESQGGLGMNEVDLVLLLEEAGRYALPAPFAETVAIGAPLLAEAGGAAAEEWLPRIAEGEAKIALGLAGAPYIADAQAADLLILQQGDALYALAPRDAKLDRFPSVDGARRLYSVEWSPTAATCIADGDAGRALAARAFDRGAWAAAAQLVGLGAQLIDLTVDYAKKRVQFGQPIGAFQAVKHHLANALTKIEFARPTTYYAANSLAEGTESTLLDVSTAKTLASEAAHLCFRTALQCHGAIAYTYEYHAHMWMKRVLVLEKTWGSASFHRKRAADVLLGPPA
jgi:alkylation response protein AidB-like acyl-CoA dehydrogenase